MAPEDQYGACDRSEDGRQREELVRPHVEGKTKSEQRHIHKTVLWLASRAAVSVGPAGSADPQDIPVTCARDSVRIGLARISEQLGCAHESNPYAIMCILPGRESLRIGV